MHTFLGNYFAFLRRCDTMLEVNATIRRCNRGYRTANQFISKKILKVLDSEGRVVYEAVSHK